jgi:hypothetical protein
MSNTTTATKAKKKAKQPKVQTEIDAATLRAVKVLSRTRERMAILKDRKERAEEVIREALGNAEIGTVAGLKVVEIMHSTSVKWNKELMEARWPDALVCEEKNPYTFIKTV